VALERAIEEQSRGFVPPPSATAVPPVDNIVTEAASILRQPPHTPLGHARTFLGLPDPDPIVRAEVRGASKIKLKNVNKKRMATARLIFLEFLKASIADRACTFKSLWGPGIDAKE
jgi:hypothetical protein